MSVRGVEQYLWRNIVRRAADSILPLAGALDKVRQTKVANFNFHVRAKEKIPKLEVAVNDLVGVHPVAGINMLNREKSGFWLCENKMAVEHVHERATGQSSRVK